jgi:hypothetical protein
LYALTRWSTFKTILKRCGKCKRSSNRALLVPAHPSRFENSDRLDGHNRRYNCNRLLELSAHAGFEVAKLRSFNALGARGWWIQYRVFVRKEHGAEHSRVMSWPLPICQPLEHLCAPPFGLFASSKRRGLNHEVPRPRWI